MAKGGIAEYGYTDEDDSMPIPDVKKNSKRDDTQGDDDEHDMDAPSNFANGGIAHYADGGLDMTNYEARREEGSLLNSSGKTGFLNSSVAGRTDRLPVAVAADSYVLPADVVSGLGQGNSLAGANILNQALRTGPYGTNIQHYSGHLSAPHAPAMPQSKKGGTTHHMPIIVAGGEFIVPPEVVERIGGGNKTKGHRLLDEMVKRIRAHTVKTISKLPKPKK